MTRLTHLILSPPVGWQAGVMVQRRGVPGAPRTYVAPEGRWPAGPWLDGTPRTVRVAAAIADALRAAIASGDLTNTAAAAKVGVSRQALQDILSGRRMPDLHTIVQAEDALDVQLWPRASDRE